MRFADLQCSYREEYKPHHVYIFTGRDIFSGKEHSVRVPAPALFKYRQGALLQDAMPMLKPEEREFLLNGVYDDL